MIYISHNLGLILATCDRITVMYSGEAVEVGIGQGSVRGDAPPLYARPLRLDPGAGRRQEQPPAGRHPRPAAAAAPAPAGLQFRPALQLLRRRPLRRAAKSPWCRCRAATSTPRAASASTRSTGTRPVGEGGRARADRAGRRRAQGRRPHQALRDREGRGLLRRSRTKDGEGEREAHLQCARGETVAIVGESGCGKSTFAKVLMGLETATEGNVVLGNHRPQPHAGREARRGHHLATCR